MLRPFFTYFGGKYRVAPHYPIPRRDVLIEPFAGSAGYSLRHPERKVILCDASPVICGVWRYLIAATEQEILALPSVVTDVRELSDSVIPEARWLIGFWLNKGSASPRLTPSHWMRSQLRPNSYWGAAIQARIASQLNQIRHWTVLEGDYQLIPNLDACWFVDPPYCSFGHLYPYGGLNFDFSTLSLWCQSRRGQVIV